MLFIPPVKKIASYTLKHGKKPQGVTYYLPVGAVVVAADLVSCLLGWLAGWLAV